MANLVYHGTVDEKVYETLSARMQDRYNIFGTLPDVIEDDWIEDIENLGEKLREFTTKKKQANAFDLRYAAGRDRRRASMGALRARSRTDGRHQAVVAGMGREGERASVKIFPLKLRSAAQYLERRQHLEASTCVR